MKTPSKEYWDTVSPSVERFRKNNLDRERKAKGKTRARGTKPTPGEKPLDFSKEVKPRRHEQDCPQLLDRKKSQIDYSDPMWRGWPCYTGD